MVWLFSNVQEESKRKLHGRRLNRRRAAKVCALAVMPCSMAWATDVRIVTFNTQGDVSSPTPTGVLPQLATVLEGIGEEKYTDGILQLPDIIALQETTSNTVTVAPLTTDLNNHYGTATFNYSSYQATTSDGTTDGGGPNALIYNQLTMNLMASVGVGTPESGTNGEFRQVVRYEFQPIADKGTSNGVFYVYDSHYKSGSAGTSADGSTDGALRNGEAQIIRNDEAANLPASAAVLYVGDYNGDGSTEAAYQTITAAKSPGGVAQGQGIDPENPTDNYNETWSSNSTYQSILSESDASLEYRDDLQLMTSNVYGDAPNVLDYVQGSYHVFGNNGTTAVGASTNLGTNTSLNDLVVGTGGVTASQVLAAMNKSTGSDHLPVVADYSIVSQVNGIWLGGTGNWSNASNWSNSTVPNSSTLEVKIDNGNAIASVVTLDQNASASDLILDANDALNIGSAYTLTLAGPTTTAINGTLTNAGTVNAVAITNTGTFTSTGTFIETGTFTNSGTASIGGTQKWTNGSTFLNTGGASTFTTDTGSTSASPLTINLSGGSVVLSSSQHLAGLSLSTGTTVTVTQQTNHVTRSLITTGALAFAGTTNAWQGKLDLATNDMDVQNGNLTNLTNQIREGYSGGTWTGTAGITSRAAANDTAHLTALGVIQNSVDGTTTGAPLYGSGTTLGLFDGASPSDTDVLVKFTYYGDANLDGQVDGSDYTLIDNGFLNQLTGWYNGDFNYDGVVDGSDYTLIDNAFNTQGGNLTSTALIAESTVLFAGSSSSVPEPAVVSLLCVGAIASLRRRRHRVNPRNQKQ